MKKRTLLLPCLTVALALGTAWAVRGKFGHEQGAAWAGAIGAMAIVLAAKRADWYARIWKIALAGAVGWGAGGMISYGVVVGYGRGLDFGNVYYGLLMLFVIGALYGLLGGGLVSFALLDPIRSAVNWPLLIVEMVAWGVLTHAFLIGQLEWLMTPPRSEAWAICMGAAIALGWHALRNGHRAVWRVARWSALGAGFGFAFGNFLQVLNASMQLKMNFWNVMEYAIGFCGGLAMAYAVFTTDWPSAENDQGKQRSFLPLLLVAVLIPFIIWDQSFEADKLDFILKQGGGASLIATFQTLAAAAMLVMALALMWHFHKPAYQANDVRYIFLLYLGVYTFLSFLQTGIYTHPVEQYLYLVNIAVIVVLLPRWSNAFSIFQERPATPWLVLCSVILLLAVLALLLISSHGELKGSQTRFPL